MKIYSWVLFIALSFLLGCSESHHITNRKFEAIETTEIQFNLNFPQKLWDDIFAKAPLTIHPERGAYEIFVPLQTVIEMEEEKGNPLGGKNFKMDFEQFGADLDWNSYLDRSNGGIINLKFIFPHLDEGDVVNVYFMGWSNPTNQKEELFGNGCDRFFNISKFFNKEMTTKGLLLHTKDLRYLYATMGRFYFIIYKKDKIKISQISFTDSLHEKGIVCPNKI